jgi:probable F420-dependent oxidoreductase
MQFGVSFPTMEIGTDPAVIRDYVQLIEGLGYSHLTIVDHVLSAREPTPTGWSRFYLSDRAFHETFVTMAFIAAVTERLELDAAVLILPQRQTALVAKQAAEIDVLSRGRMVLGVGLGWNAVEYEALNQNFKNRNRRIEEQVEVLRLLWTQELVTYEGRWHRIPDAGLNPMPVQRPIPIWFGAFADPAIVRAAQLGDGWFMNPRVGADDEARRQVALFRNSAREAGRDPDSLPIDVTIHVKEGPEDGWREKVRLWRDIGVTRITFRTHDCGLPDVAAHRDALQRFRSAVADFA